MGNQEETRKGGKRKGQKNEDKDELPFFADITRSLRPCELEMVSHKAVTTFNVEPWQ